MKLAWDFSLLADRLAAIIASTEGDLRAEQAVYGLDSRDERQLQQLLSENLSAFYDVTREAHYPASAGSKLTHRKRCDLVLTPRGSPLKLDFLPPTLFDHPNPCAPPDALWLEVKAAWQFRAGGQTHAGYGAQWRKAIVQDLRKMEGDAHIKHAGLLLVVFNESREILQKDLELFQTVLAEQEVLAGEGQTRATPIQDRIGHQFCTIAIWPTIQR
jgi:hypothetical protein